MDTTINVNEQVDKTKWANIDFKFGKKGDRASVFDSGYGVKNIDGGPAMILGDYEMSNGKFYWFFQIQKMTWIIAFGVASADINLNSWPYG